MKATKLQMKLAVLIEKYGDVPVEIDATGYFGIVPAVKVRFEESDSERGNTIVIEGGV